jgi:hypothetical protein
MALLISVGNMGGICGSNIYLGREAPKYPTGFGVSFATSCTSVIFAYILRLGYAADNRKREKLLDEEGEEAIKARYSEQELLDLGDRSPFYKYTL